MKRHILGFSIFSIIVVSAIFVFSFFKPFVIPEVPMSVPVEDDRPYSCWTDRRTVSARVHTAEYDERTGELVVDTKLSWNGRDHAPGQLLYFNVLVLNKGKGPGLSTFHSGLALKQFDGPESMIERVRFSRYDTEDFQDFDNIYVHIETSEDGKFTSTQSDRLTSAKYLPVLKVHK